MKKIFILFLFISINVFSQKESDIEKLLNKELNKELKLQKESSYFEGDTLIVIEPYKIEHNILSVTVKKRVYNTKELYLEKQEIALDKINSIIKDINVIFETEPDAVKITQTDMNGTVSKTNYNLFFLHLSTEKNNESLAKNIIKTFKKHGYSIENRFWFD